MPSRLQPESIKETTVKVAKKLFFIIPPTLSTFYQSTDIKLRSIGVT